MATPIQESRQKRDLLVKVMDATGLPRVGAIVLLRSLRELEQKDPQKFPISKLNPNDIISFLRQLMPKLADKQAMDQNISAPVQDSNSLDDMLAKG